MRPRQKAVLFLVLAVLSAPLASGAGKNAPRLPAASVNAHLRTIAASPTGQAVAAARFMEALPALPAASALKDLPAAQRARWIAASLLADPAAAAAQSTLAPAVQAVHAFLEGKPELVLRLAEIRRQFDAGKLAEAARLSGRLYDNASAADGTPAVSAASGSARRAPSLAKAQPPWAKGVFLPRTVDVPIAGDPLGVTVHRLANGMTVYLSPNRQEPRVSFEIAVRAGSRHDPLEATGMAHYLEHMQFKGSARLGTIDHAKEKPHLDRIERLYDELFETKDAARRDEIYAEIDAESLKAARYAIPNEFDKLYAVAGFTDVNAHTSYEETVYKGSFPSNKAEAWARVEADRLTDPVYRIFLPELETVYEEYNRGLDDPSRAFYDAAQAALFKGHPYARSVLGLGEHLKNPSISRMRRFFRDYYRPNNMAVVLSGDFDRQEMLDLVARTFGKLEPAKVPPPPPGKIEKRAGVERVEIEFQASEAVQVDWLLPGHGHPDEDALLLAGKLFFNLLAVRVEKAQRTKNAYAYALLNNEAGAWFAIAVPKEGQTPEQAESVLMEEVGRLKAGDFTDEDLKTAIVQLQVEHKQKLQDNAERASSITDSYIQGKQWDEAASQFERLERLTKADVVAAVNRHLGEDRVVTMRRRGTPKGEKVAKPSFTAVPIDTARESAFFKETMALPSKPLKPRFLRRGRDYRTLDRAWGRLYAAPNPVNDLFHLEFRFDRGYAHEKNLDLALSLLDVSGAGDLSVDQFQKKLDRMGSTMEMSCEEQECVVTLTGLEQHLEETLRLALLRFAKPNVAAGALRELLKVERANRASRKLDAKTVHQALGEYASRGEASKFLKQLSATELDALTENELERALASFFDYRRTVLYTGNKSVSEIARLLSSAQSRRRYRRPPTRSPVTLLEPRRPRVVFVHREGMKQALVGAYAADGPFDPAALLDYRVYDNVMNGGMGGIYFQEVRESRALAYTAQGSYKPAERPEDDNKTWSYAGTQADKAVQTALLLRELMSRPPITPQRFDQAHEQTEQSYRTEIPQLAAIPAKAHLWERLGLTQDPGPEALAGLSAYDEHRLERFVARFKDKPLTFYVLGDRASVDLEGLKQLGDLEERSVDDLFPY